MEEVEESVVVGKDWNFSISKDKAEWLYEKAGELIPEAPDQITVNKYKNLLSDKVHLVIQEVLLENQIAFQLQDFQLLTLHALGNFQNVILVNPTGSGRQTRKKTGGTFLE